MRRRKKKRQKWQGVVKVKHEDNPSLRKMLYKKLYKIWTRPILERDNFTCQKCGQKGGKLEVHHNKKTLAEIISLFVIDTRKLSFEEKKIVCDKILNYHASGRVFGITLCLKCHKEEEKKKRLRVSKSTQNCLHLIETIYF
ncbi:MAG: hypothetical protein KAX49_03925 [Halanaerobiales bacterium]|nr:hypothetical protein [Halanaerobiales bacterium]